MSSQPSWKYYKSLSEMSPIRAIAEGLFSTKNFGKAPKIVSPKEAYEIATQLPWVAITDLKIDEGNIKRLGLSENAKVFNENNGKTVGRSASSRIFYNKLSKAEKNDYEELVRESIYDLQKNYDLIIGEAVVGLDKDLMFKARIICPIEDAANLFFWFANFNPLSAVPEYESSVQHPVQDILFVSHPAWQNPNPNQKNDSLVVIDEKHNTIMNFGLRYFGERKKGTLTMAWTAAQRLGHVSAHGGIKEIDFSNCEGDLSKKGKKTIAFYGLSGSGKSSHTNSLDNGETLPLGFKRKIAHDDAFQIDIKNRLCYVWEPTLFDKIDSRELDDSDWPYCVGTMNALTCEVDNKIMPYGMDTRNNNGRAIFARELLGETANRIGFPNYIGWLMKDDTLPPIMKLNDVYLAVAMGTTLMTKRSSAENISPEEMKKLVFEPFANPFRVYPLYEDSLGYAEVFKAGCQCFVWSGGGSGFWNGSSEKTKAIPLQTSLTLQTAILTEALEWEDWPLIPNTKIPNKKSIEKILPGYYDTYNPNTVANYNDYLVTLKDRFKQRINFLKNSDLQEKPELLEKLIKALQVNG